MKHQHKMSRSLLAGAALLAAPVASQALEIQAGDWKFSMSGNVNVHFINSQCEDSPEAVAGGLACAVTGEGEDSTSSVSNGLLPAAFVFGASTTQKGWDLSANLGLYPGVSSNDGGSPNLGSDRLNTGLSTTGLDVRQVFMTFGKKELGTFTLGRNFGLFGFDSIINDMTLPGVGASGAMASANPSNTTLGGIGYGYIYTDTLAQINYTTPDLGGVKVTVGIYDPVEPLNAFTPGTAPQGADSMPGFHGKVAFTSGGLYLSASFLTQENNVPSGAVTDDAEFDTRAFDIGGKFATGPFEVMAWYYTGKGIGTTAFLFDATDGAGDERDSDGFIAQVSYKIADTKLGLNYGESNLELADGDGPEAASTIVDKNSKVTFGVYHALTPNLTLLAEFSDVNSEAHNGNENSATNFNVGAFFAF